MDSQHSWLYVDLLGAWVLFRFAFFQIMFAMRKRWGSGKDRRETQVIVQHHPSLSPHSLRQGSEKCCCLRIRENLCQNIRINAFRNSYLPFFLLHMQLRIQVLLTVESFFKKLSVFLSVFSVCQGWTKDYSAIFSDDRKQLYSLIRAISLRPSTWA